VQECYTLTVSQGVVCQIVARAVEENEAGPASTRILCAEDSATYAITAFDEAWSLAIAYLELAIVHAVNTSSREIVQPWIASKCLLLG